jgi:DNA replication protein DnaC
MLLEQTVDKLNQMKLYGMAKNIKERLTRTDHKDLTAEELMGFIVDDEWLYRENRRMTSLMKNARFKQSNACVENVDYQRSRGLKKTTFLEFGQNRWLTAHQNLAITGPSGVGKSYLAQALGTQACRAGYRVLYLRFPKLLVQLVHVRADGTYSQFLAKLAKVQLLIVDDFGLSPMKKAESQDMLEIIEDRYGAGATLVTSQLPVDQWHEHLGGGIVGDAICDRLLHNCHRIELTGDSARKDMAALITNSQSAK